MYRHFGNFDYPDGAARSERDAFGVTRSGGLDALVALERLGVRLAFTRDQEIYAEGDRADCWYKVLSGTVRICKLLADGRRHIGEFCFSGDCFGVEDAGQRAYSAEAVNSDLLRHCR